MVRVQTLPRSAEAYYSAQKVEQRAALAAVQRQWARLAPGAVAASWDALAPTLLAVVLTAQRRVAAPGAQYVDDVLAETGSSVDPFVATSSAALVGYAGDGRPIEGLLSEAPRKTLNALSAGVSPLVAQDIGGRFLNLAVSSTLADTSRASENLAMNSRPDLWYVRMLSPKACSRCAILAGQKYRSSVAFERHPGCLCTNIPSSEAVAGDITLDTKAYFDSLPETDQSRVFTNAGAEAIRAGADPAQVVNARRGMSTAAQNQRDWIPKGRLTSTRLYGRDLYLTNEGVTRRGQAYNALVRGDRANDVKVPGRRNKQTRAPRLMPESIVEIAEDRADLVRLLRLNGYVT